MSENTDTVSNELRESMEEEERRIQDLAMLFGTDTVAQAVQIDVADLNMNEKMTAAISDGVKKLKALKADPDAQAKLIQGMDPGSRLVLCMWIMDMGLVEKIRRHDVEPEAGRE